MLRRVGGLLLVVVAGVSLMPWVQQSYAYLASVVNMPSGQPALYEIASTTSATKPLIICTVDETLRILSGTATTAQFNCKSRHPSSIVVNFHYIATQGDGGVITSATGTATLQPGGAICHTVSITGGSGNNVTRTVRFQAVTDDNQPIYASLFFGGSVNLRNNHGNNPGPGGGCNGL